MVAFGVDLAARGEDKTVVAVRNEFAVPVLHTWSKDDTMESVGKVIELSRRYHPETIIVDADGMGAPVYDRLREQGFPVVPFRANAKCERTDRSGVLQFANWRAYMWWHMRERLHPDSEPKVLLPRDDDLIGELCAPKWKENSSGKIQVESKDDIRKRLGRSTDKADAVCMAFTDLDNASFAENYTVVTGREAEQLVRQVTPERPPEEEAALEKLLWSGGQPINIWDF